MRFFVQRSELRDLYDKVAAGERISETDALRLFESKDLNVLGAIADLARQRKVGNRASYIINRYINYSNYCILNCQFCAFARKKRDKDGFELTIPEIVQKAREALQSGITELHIVGGLHPSLPFTYYTDLLKALRALDPRLQLKCFTAIEVLHLAWIAKKSVAETLRALKEAGLDSLTGGGRGNFSQGNPLDHRQGKRIRRGISRRSSAVAPHGRTQHLHDALWPCRVPRGSGGPFALSAGAAGRDAGVCGVCAVAVSPGEQRNPGCESAQWLRFVAYDGSQPDIPRQL